MTLPGAPTITEVFAGDPNSTGNPTEVGVRFTAGPSNGSPITGYTTTCTPLAPNSTGNPTGSASGPTSPIFIGGLGAKGAYQCTATATNLFGTSAPSAPFLMFVGGTGNCTTVPSAPGNVTTAPGNASATVSWSPSDECVAGYLVTPYLGSVAQHPILIPGKGTTTVVKNLTNGAAYHFTVQAENGFVAGPASADSATITVGAPTAAVVVSAAKAGKGAVKLAFAKAQANGAPITKYTATCKSKNGGAAKIKAGKKSPITIGGLTPGKTYTCVVRATNSRGTGPASRASKSVKA